MFIVNWTNNQLWACGGAAEGDKVECKNRHGQSGILILFDDISVYVSGQL